MIVETLADVNDTVYFINDDKIVKDFVTGIYITVEINIDSIIITKITYTLANYGTADEQEIGLTQEGLFEKIKLIEDEAKSS